MANQNFNAALYGVSSAGAAVSITLAALAAGSPENRTIQQIQWGYDATPAAGCTLTITDGGTTVFKLPITTAGPGFTQWPGGKQASAVTNALVVTLSAPGGSILGYLTVG